MVRIVLICFLIGLGFNSFSQGYPVPQNLGTATTLVTNSGGLTGGFILRSYSDTVAANTALYFKTYTGALFFSTSNNAIFFRDKTASKWVQLIPAADTSGTQSWLVNGNSIFSSTIPPWMGSVGQSSVGFRTNSTIRYTIPSTGIVNNNGAGVKTLGVDTADPTRPLVYTTGGGGGSGWLLTGNAGTVAGTNFIGTTDAVSLVFKVNNGRAGFLDVAGSNTLFGTAANSLAAGEENTSVGHSSLNNITSGNGNEAYGVGALGALTTGNNNVGIGGATGATITTGGSNTFLGSGANASASNSTNRTAIGANAYVTQNNSLVLGGINGTNGAIADTKVGIGVTAPTEALHVANNFRLQGAFMPNNTAGTTGQVLTSAGAGTVPTWTTPATVFPSWRLGGNTATDPSVDYFGTQDAADISIRYNAEEQIRVGNRTLRWGEQTNVASGQFATAFGGEGNIASGNDATAFGSTTIASGEQSTTWGITNTATANAATAFGNGTIASAELATAFGQVTKASKAQATAWGYGAEANGLNATAWGHYTTATGENSTVWGDSSQATGEASTSFGKFTFSNGEYSSAIGFGIKSQGFGTTSIGTYNDSTSAADAEDYNGQNIAFEVGNGTADNARSNAFAIKFNGATAFNGSYGTAGYLLQSNGSSSSPTWVVAPTSTSPAGSNKQVQYNNSGSFGASSNFIWDNSNSRLGINSTPDSTLDVTGGLKVTSGATFGKTVNISDGFRLNWLGASASITGSSALGVLSLNSVFTDIGPQANAVFRVQSMTGYVRLESIIPGVGYQPMDINTSGQPISMNANVYIGGLLATPTAQLHTTGTVRFAIFGAGAATFDASGNISSVSDERYKTGINYSRVGLKEIMQLRPINYKWNKLSGMEMNHTYTGFSAQNVKAVIPNGTGENKDGYLSLQDRSILAAAIVAIQDLKKIIDKQQKQINRLKKRK